METNDKNEQDPKYNWSSPEVYNNCEPQGHSRAGRALGGLVIVVVGAVLLAKQIGVPMPVWLFTWQMFLIVAGIYVGARHTFRSAGWLFPVAVGVLFLIDIVFPGTPIKPFLLPMFIILIGLIMIFRRKTHFNHWEQRFRASKMRKWQKYEKYKKYKDYQHHYDYNRHYHYRDSSSEEFVEVVSVFGGIKKNIISKTFKGGDVTCFFGGTEINLSQADIEGKVTLDITQVFGGTKIIIPSHWEIQPEVVAILGNIEDKRPAHKDVQTDAAKILVLRGTSVFGGITIDSF